MKGSEALKNKLWPLGVKIEKFWLLVVKKLILKFFFLMDKERI